MHHRKLCKLLARSRLGLGLLYRLTRREEGQAELSSAVDLLRSMGMAFWVAQVEGLLQPNRIAAADGPSL